ncbi:DUF1700 domain-containing protein [Shimazuella kribbensis]|uniref:DUF1700 domain-containing protein n=1 Tax=Shimazuella kribbensis TaxID=139808 RepID=UPI00040423C2|nr:DUF1700 domain-containing protein [Shimazuella kribbensis]
MNKNEFLSELNRHLQKLPKSEQEAAIEDYEEHFEHGVFEGRSEADIATSLGNPRKIARELVTEYHLEHAEQHNSYYSITRAVFAFLGLGFLNLVFVLAPFIAIVAVIIASYAVSFVFVISPLSVFVALFGDDSWQSILLLLFATLGLLGVGLILGTVTTKFSKIFFQWFTRYLKSNQRIIRGERK